MATPQPQQPQVYYGGQIRAQHQGDLAAVVAEVGQPDAGAFIYSVDSAEFRHLTGMGSVGMQIARVYIGINPEAGRIIAEAARTFAAAPDRLRSLDQTIVSSNFLREERAVPVRA